ncbi:MAG: myo-inosose-2 dehydratase [Rhodobacteraceae bacterium]|nr:myo-inosose-2 dehydratase [Paracoccaceae bacterium]
MTVRLGISPIGWTNDAIADLGADIPLETCLGDAAGAGFAGVELGRQFPHAPAEVQSALAPFGLVPITAWHSGYLSERDVDAEWPAALAHAKRLKALGCNVMVYGECGAGAEGGADAPLSRRPPDLALFPYARRLSGLACRIAAIGLKLVYHHHVMHPVETASQIDALMEASDPSVQLLLDTGHLALAGDDYAAVMRRWWSRIGHIHLKDIRRATLETMDRTTTTFDDGVRLGMFTVPGDGDLDFAPVAEQIAQAGYGGWIVVEAEQDPKNAAPAVMANTAFAYITRLFDALGIKLEGHHEDR